MVTIAHRLSTIIGHDKVLVMAQGMAVDFGDPWELLEEAGEDGKKGFFKKMVAESGQEEILRAAAKAAWDKRQKRP